MAKRVDIFIDQGSDFSKTFVSNTLLLANSDLTGYSYSGSFKKHHESVATYDFVVSGNSTTFTMTMNHANTSTIDPGIYVYDCLGIKSNNYIRLVEGMLEVSPSAQ